MRHFIGKADPRLHPQTGDLRVTYHPAWVILAVGIHAPRGIAAPAFAHTLRSRRGRRSVSNLPDVPAGDGAAASLAGSSPLLHRPVAELAAAQGPQPPSERVAAVAEPR